MLNTPSELSNDDANSEDLKETTEELEESTDETTLEGEELEETDDEDSESDDEEEAFLVGDEEITKSEFEQMKKNQMLQSDYTKKRQAEAAQLKARMSEIDALLAQADTLESFLDEDEQNVDWDDFVSNSELRKAEAKFKARRKQIQKIRDEAMKQKNTVSGDVYEATNKAVFEHFKDWEGNDKRVQEDRKLALDYAKSIGHTEESLNATTRPQDFIALIEAARMKKELEDIKNAKPEKKLKRKAPKTVKGKKAQAKPKSWADVFYS